MRARITAAEVLEAYEKTGFRPAQGIWLEGAGGPNECACGLTAFAYAVEPTIPARCWDFEAFDMLRDILELERWYAEGFVDGFDSEVEPEWKATIDWDHAYLRGLEDGKAAWQAVRHLAAEESK